MEGGGECELPLASALRETERKKSHTASPITHSLINHTHVQQSHTHTHTHRSTNIHTTHTLTDILTYTPHTHTHRYTNIHTTHTHTHTHTHTQYRQRTRPQH